MVERFGYMEIKLPFLKINFLFCVTGIELISNWVCKLLIRFRRPNTSKFRPTAWCLIKIPDKATEISLQGTGKRPCLFQAYGISNPTLSDSFWNLIPDQVQVSKGRKTEWVKKKLCRNIFQHNQYIECLTDVVALRYCVTSHRTKLSLWWRPMVLKNLCKSPSSIIFI